MKQTMKKIGIVITMALLVASCGGGAKKARVLKSGADPLTDTPKTPTTDELLQKQQIVMKNLEDRFSHIEGITGCTILSDGRIGFIISPEEFVEVANSKAN